MDIYIFLIMCFLIFPFIHYDLTVKDKEQTVQENRFNSSPTLLYDTEIIMGLASLRECSTERDLKHHETLLVKF
jgi:hypothetical protein